MIGFLAKVIIPLVRQTVLLDHMRHGQKLIGLYRHTYTHIRGWSSIRQLGDFEKQIICMDSHGGMTIAHMTHGILPWQSMAYMVSNVATRPHRLR